jgi:hypothetical protein
MGYLEVDGRDICRPCDFSALEELVKGDQVLTWRLPQLFLLDVVGLYCQYLASTTLSIAQTRYSSANYSFCTIVPASLK